MGDRLSYLILSWFLPLLIITIITPTNIHQFSITLVVLFTLINLSISQLRSDTNATSSTVRSEQTFEAQEETKMRRKKKQRDELTSCDL